MTCGHTKSKTRSPFHHVTGWIVVAIAYCASVWYVGFFVL